MAAQVFEVALQHGLLRDAPGGKHYTVPLLTDPELLSSSATRVRKHRLHKRGLDPSHAPGNAPCYTLGDGRDIAQVIRQAGARVPGAFPLVAVRALNSLTGVEPDPKQWLLDKAATALDEARKLSTRAAGLWLFNPMAWLNGEVSRRLDRELDLRLQTPQRSNAMVRLPGMSVAGDNLALAVENLSVNVGGAGKIGGNGMDGKDAVKVNRH